MNISLKNISFSYSESLDDAILENLNLEIRSGECVVLAGESGCGKTSLLNMIAGITGFDSGDIIINDDKMSEMTQKQKADFAGALPEDLREVAAGWTRLRSLMPPGLGMLKGYLGQSIPRQGEGGCLLIELGNPMAYEHYKDDEETKQLLQEFLLEQTGKQIRIEFKALDNEGENADNYPDLRPLDGFEGFDKINMDIETED